jgi:hypothetical protein
LTWLHVRDNLPVDNGGRAEAERYWGMGVEMAERGRPSALRALFIAERGGGKAMQAAGGAVAASKLWARQSGGSCCPNADGAVGRLFSDRVTDWWVPRGF